MDDEGYVEHRRPHQGHDHPRRREHLPARGRGVPATPTRRSRDVQVDRRARTSATARRSGLGQLPAEGADLDEDGCARSAASGSRASRSRATCAFVDALPADRHGQGAEVPHARAGDRRARADVRAHGMTGVISRRTSAPCGSSRSAPSRRPAPPTAPGTCRSASGPRRSRRRRARPAARRTRCSRSRGPS